MDYTFLSRYLAPVNDSVSALEYPRLLASSSLCHVTSLKVKMAVAAAVAPLVYLPMPTEELWGTKESMEGRTDKSIYCFVGISEDMARQIEATMGKARKSAGCKRG